MFGRLGLQGASVSADCMLVYASVLGQGCSCSGRAYTCGT